MKVIVTGIEKLRKSRLAGLLFSLLASAMFFFPSLFSFFAPALFFFSSTLFILLHVFCSLAFALLFEKKLSVIGRLFSHVTATVYTRYGSLIVVN